MDDSLQKRIWDALWPAGSTGAAITWAVLDSARDGRIFGRVDGSHLNKSCLYSGALPWQLEMTAPYLLELERDDEFVKWLVHAGWGRSWGVFLRTETGEKQLRRRLRELLTVQDERGRRLLFRWYDPRVLRLYLPTCRPAELKTVFGPIDCFLMENDDPGEMLEFRLTGEGLAVRRIPLRVAAARA